MRDQRFADCSKRRPTKRAPDVWESARFTGIFLASSFVCFQAESTPAHTQVTQTVGQPVQQSLKSCKNMQNADKKRTLEGRFYKVANGHDSYEIFYATPDIIFAVSNILVAKFGCSPIDLPTFGLDVVITTCQQGNIKLELGWDNWSGFYIFANSPEGDDLVKDIGTYLNTIIGGSDFEKHIHYW